MLTETAAPAALTAVHLTMAILRRHRASGRAIVSPFVLPSFFFVLVPWLWPTALGLVAGAIAHLAWFFACELLAPVRATPPAKAAPQARRPMTSTTPAFAVTTVLAVLDEATDIKTFRMARPEGFTFSPGQFLAVRVLVDGKPHVRCYSISSAPHAQGYLEISVRRQGLVSGTLHATIRAGSTLTINRPSGQFVYPEGDDRPLALIAGGIGITPLLSMLRHAVAADPERPITLLYSARREHDVAFLGELRLLAERHPHVRVAITLTQSTGPTRLRTGRLDAEMLRQHVPAPAHTIFCLCGPGPMIADIRATLATLGVPAGQVRCEQFEIAAAASQVNRVAAPSAEFVAASAGDSVRVTFEESRVSVAAQASRTLLETAEAEGVAILSSCRAGVCQSCRTRLKTGEADCRSDVLDPEDLAAGFVLPCVTWPIGDCVLEA
ncbi:MAG: iron-sulfur cluster-binding domain-containing protein [Vicinamibacterales bacterium]